MKEIESMKDNNMNKKVLLVRSTPSAVNADVYNLQQFGIGKSFVQKGYDYDFITFKKSEPKRDFIFYESNGCRARCIELPRVKFFRWGINRSICTEEFLSQYDLIICQEYYQLETYLISCKSDKVIMYTGPYYNMFSPKFFSPIYDVFFTRRVNKQIKRKFVKSVLAYDYMEKKGYTGLEIVGVALDTTRFENVEILPETQKLVDYMTENRCLLYVGTRIPRKNYPFLLEVYQRVLEKAPDIKLVTIGKSRVTSFEKKFLGKKDEDYALSCEARLPEEVKRGIFHLDRMENPQLKFIYPLAKAFLLPSVLEIFGMVLLEAMYHGTPIVSSENGGSLTLMADGTCGQIVKEFDADKWADAIMKYLDDEEYVKKVVAAGQNKLKTTYNWSNIVDRFIDAMEV